MTFQTGILIPTPQFGLVAEQVEKVNPDLVVLDADGKVNTVRYEAVNAMLLNEFLNEHWKMQEQERKMHQQEASIARLQALAAREQKGMEILAARLKEQAAQIQKVGAQIELSKPLPQTLASDQ